MLWVTRSKAKMYEYGVPEENHLRIHGEPANLFPLTIGMLGDLSVQSCSSEIDEELLNELRTNLRFSAHFFDAYLEAGFDHSLDPYLLLLGSASYYLCGYPGSSLVLAKQIGDICPDLDGSGLEYLLLWLLNTDIPEHQIRSTNGIYRDFILEIYRWLLNYYDNGDGEENLYEITEKLREHAYHNGPPHQLLFTDTICAIVKLRIENSTWYSLPTYSGLTIEQWRSIFQKGTFIRELWPAQHLLGTHGVFQGQSAIVQMPTSAGKTKAAEIIIRSAFISERASLAVIVAPFRALCTEIREDMVSAFQGEPVNIDLLSDVLQVDFAAERFIRNKQVLVVTPEKLVYVLRHSPELAEHIGLLIYDEGHMFDNGSRGITYELLLSSLKSLVSEEVQSVLISAVISNADTIGAWLHGEDSATVSGIGLSPTSQSIAFASWQDMLGRLEFANSDLSDRAFYVPRLITQQQLQLGPRERRERFFPERDDTNDIALYFGLKVVRNGGVAVFCGRKSTAANICKRVIDIYDRGLEIPPPSNFSDQNELARLQLLYERNMGGDAIATQCANLGIFSHHGNTPHGIRLAVEFAMKEGWAKYVICTSTLAQGVNLPIRYLIVTNTRQGRNRIKVRDFHNLVGRAGRSGIYTEGTVIFADPSLLDQRGRRWDQVRELLDPRNSEPCESTILLLFTSLPTNRRREPINLNPIGFTRAYIEDAEQLMRYPSDIIERYPRHGFSISDLNRYFSLRVAVLASIESYMLAYLDDSGTGVEEADVTELARGTLAHYLADEEQQNQIIEIFHMLSQNIGRRVPNIQKRKVFGKTLFGLDTSLRIEEWLSANIDNLLLNTSQEDLLAALWLVLIDI
jgi:hypothetical protein